MGERNIIVRTNRETGIRERLTPEMEWRDENDCDYKSRSYVRFDSSLVARITCDLMDTITIEYDLYKKYTYSVELD